MGCDKTQRPVVNPLVWGGKGHELQPLTGCSPADQKLRAQNLAWRLEGQKLSATSNRSSKAQSCIACVLPAGATSTTRCVLRSTCSWCKTPVQHCSQEVGLCVFAIEPFGWPCRPDLSGLHLRPDTAAARLGSACCRMGCNTSQSKEPKGGGSNGPASNSKARHDSTMGGNASDSRSVVAPGDVHVRYVPGTGTGLLSCRLPCRSV
jgi:hypothetical protein